MALQTLKMRGLGTKGVVSDLAPFDTGVESWSEAHNIRFNNGMAEKTRGYIPVFYNNRLESGAMTYLGINQIPMHLIYRPLHPDQWFYCTQNAIWMTDGWEHKRISPDKIVGDTAEGPGTIPYEAPWSSTIISNSIVVNSKQLDAPLGKLDGSDVFEPLPKFSKNWEVDTIRTYKNFLMAIGGGDTYPQRVRWSNIVPPNALPSDWGWEIDDAGDEGAFIDGSAGGYNDISFARGKIVDGKPLRDQFIIYTTEEVVTCEYVGSNDIFRFRSLFDDGGAINPDCVAEFNNSHFVVSANDIYIHNGSSKKSVIDNKVRVELIDKLTSNRYESVKVVPYLTENEIWITYAGNDAVGVQSLAAEVYSIVKEATKAAIYNFKEETWSFIDLPRTNDIKLGPVPIYDENKVKPDAWSRVADNYLWEDSVELWNLAGGGSSHNFREHSLICASTDGGFYVLDRGNYYTTLDDYDTETKRWTLYRDDVISTVTKTYIDLDDVTETIDYKTVLSVWPQVRGDGEIYIRVGGAEVPGGTVTWGDAIKYVCGKDRKVDLRVNNRYLCVEVSGRGVGDWQLSGFDAVVRIGGRR